MQQTIHRAAIIIKGDRQRKEFDGQAMADLMATIKSKGLMHAPVMRETEEGLVLVAGERRLRALEDLWMLGDEVHYNGEVIPEGFVPYVTLGQLSELEAEEAELHENLHRKDLTWQENAAAMAKLHSLRSRQAQAEGRIHTVADTAVEAKGRGDGSYQQSVRVDLIVAKHLDNPEVMKAKTAEEAFKILKKQEDTKRNIDLAVSVGKTYTASIHELHNTNCLTWLAACPPETFDVILTDPPYGMGADSFGDGAGKLGAIEHHYKDDYESWKALMGEWVHHAFRVAKREAHAYVFCDLDNFHELKKMMQQAGWYVTRTPFICTKPNSGRVPHPDMGPRRQWEMILYAVKGNKKTNAIYPDVITTMADPNCTHGAQKPVALYTNLLQRSVKPGDTVLDSFAGSGTIFSAAQQYKVKAVGLEMNPEYYSFCYKRLQGLSDEATATGKALGDELAALMGK